MVARTEELIALARAGDQDAFAELDRQHRHRLVRSLAWSAGRPVGAALEIEEAVEEALAYVFMKIRDGRFDGPQTEAGFRVYVRKAAQSHLVAAGRRRHAQKRGRGRVQRLSEVLTTTAADLGFAARDSGPATKAQKLEEAERFEALLLRLLEADRAVVDARWNLGLSFPEIAALLGTTPSGARVRCWRAKDKLKDLLRQDGFATEA